MKRVKAACICQTLHFLLKEDVEHNYAVKLVQEEVAHYKATMDRNKTYATSAFRMIQTELKTTAEQENPATIMSAAESPVGFRFTATTALLKRLSTMQGSMLRRVALSTTMITTNTGIISVTVL